MDQTTPHLPAEPLHDGHIRRILHDLDYPTNGRLYDLVHEAYNRGLQDGYKQAKKGKGKGKRY